MPHQVPLNASDDPVAAAANPAAYEPALARSLNNLSNRLAEAGRREDADPARSEAAEVQERVDRRRGPHLPLSLPSSRRGAPSCD